MPSPVFARLLVAPVSLILLLVACGGQPDSAAPPATPSAAPTAADSTGPATATATAAPTATPATTATANLTDGCADDAAAGDLFPDKVTFDEATGVTVTYSDTYKVVEVAPPSLAEPLRYVLVQCGTAPPAEGEHAGAQMIEVPVEEIVTLTTTNLPHLDALDAVDRLVGVGTGAFVSTPSVAERVAAGDIPDFADEAGQPDLERLVAADPDLLVTDAFGDTVLDDVRRTIDAGVPTVVNADFDERTLLGRAEWLKYTALFLNAEAAANATYEDVAASYAETAALAAAATERPSVLLNTPFEGTWFVPGGASFQADAIADAGGDYVFADDDATGSLALDIEAVLDRAAQADIWLQAGSVNGTLDDLVAMDQRFTAIEAFADGEVYAYDALTTEGGGNAVFEEAYTRADLYLADLTAMLHPELLPDHDLRYFGRVPSADGEGG
ncbi:MAG: ABC transporter substrate-binding protein [Egibacteraceae bacterium]